MYLNVLGNSLDLYYAVGFVSEGKQNKREQDFISLWFPKGSRPAPLGVFFVLRIGFLPLAAQVPAQLPQQMLPRRDGVGGGLESVEGRLKTIQMCPLSAPDTRNLKSRCWWLRDSEREAGRACPPSPWAWGVCGIPGVPSQCLPLSPRGFPTTSVCPCLQISLIALPGGHQSLE